jgi:hypothetical protein
MLNDCEPKQGSTVRQAASTGNRPESVDEGAQAPENPAQSAKRKFENIPTRGAAAFVMTDGTKLYKTFYDLYNLSLETSYPD